MSMSVEEYLQEVDPDETDEQGRGLWQEGHTIFRDHDPFLELLSDDDRMSVSDCAGIIMEGGEAIIVYTSYYELDTDWRSGLAEEE